MTGQATGFWKVRHAVIGLAVVGILVLLMSRGCGGEPEDAMHGKATEDGISQQGVYVKVPAEQAQTRAPQIQQGYQQQPAYGQAPGYGYQPQQPGGQQQPVYGQAPGYGYQQQQPVYGYSTQPPPPAQVQPEYSANDAENPWASPAPGYQQQPAQWGQRQAPAPSRQAPQWGQPQQPVYSRLPGGSQYRPLDEKPKDPQPGQQITVPLPALQAWAGAPYDRRGGSSFGNNGGGAWTGGYTGYGYNPGYPGAAPYGGWPGGYMGGWPGAAPGRW